MKRLLIVWISAGLLLTGCQLSNPFSRPSASNTQQGQSTASNSRFDLFPGSRVPTEELLQQAQQAHEANDATGAAALYEHVLEQDSENVTAHHRLAVILDNQGEFVQAEQHYRAALDLSPADPNIIGDLGYSYLLQGRLSEAEPYLVRARSLDPSLPHVVMNLGILYARQGNWAKSEEMFAIVLPPEQVRTEMLKHGMPLPPAFNEGDASASRIASGQTPTESWPADASPETIALMQQLEQARLQGEQQRLQLQQQREMLDAYQRQQAAAAGYPYDPEGERLRDEMNQIDRSTLPDNSGTMVIGPSGTQTSSVQTPGQGTIGTPQTARPSATSQWPSQPTATGTAQQLPVNPVSQQTQWPGQSDSTGVAAHDGSTNVPGTFQPAPIYRGLPAGSDNTQLAGQFAQPGGAIQQAGDESIAANPVQQAYTWGQQGPSELAHYETDQWGQGSSQQAVTQSSGVVPQQPSVQSVQPAQMGDINAFDAAARSAAIMGLGVGGGAMFPIATPLTPQVSPGAGSMMHGGMYPEVERQLPTDRLMDMNQSFQYQPDGSLQSQAQEMRPASNSMGQTMPSVMAQTQDPATSGVPASPWQSTAGSGASSAVPPNPLAEYDQMRAENDAYTQQTLQQTQGMTPSHYMVAPVSEINPQIPLPTGSQLMMNSPPAETSAAQPNPWGTPPASLNEPSQPVRGVAPTSQSSWPQGQSQSSPYYPTGQLAPSPWDSVPRIDPSAVQSNSPQAGNGYVTPPPYNPQSGTSSQTTSGTSQPTASGYPPNQGPVIRPRQ